MRLEFCTDLSGILHLQCLGHRSQVPNCPEIDRGGLKADLWRRFLFVHIQNLSIELLHGCVVFGEVQYIALGGSINFWEGGNRKLVLHTETTKSAETGRWSLIVMFV